MANDAAKKRLKENHSRMKWLLAVLCGCAAFHILFLFLRPTSLWQKVKFAFSLTAAVASYSFLRVAARPQYSAEGALVSGGGDLRTGLADAASDLLLLCSIVHVLAVRFDAAWLLLLLVPGRAIFWAWKTVLKDYLYGVFESAQPTAAGETAKSKGRRPVAAERDAKQKGRKR